MNDESIRLYDDEIPLSLELIGSSHSDGQKERGLHQNVEPASTRPSVFSIERIEEDASHDNLQHQLIKNDSDTATADTGPKVRLVVSIPGNKIDTDIASHLVDRLLDELSESHSSCGRTQYVLESLSISNLRFTAGGISAMSNFFVMQNAPESVRKIVFRNVISFNDTIDDKNHLAALCRIFVDSSLISIDASDNVIEPFFWEVLGNQKDLRTLILENVTMKDTSFQQLQSIFDSGDTLNVFHISNTVRTGKPACEALNQILGSCHDLRSFCWEIKSEEHHPGCYPPVVGLAQLSKNIFKSEHGYMKHLELTGGLIIIGEDDTNSNHFGICAALEGFHKLQHLKISRAGLTSEKTKRIITALRSARPPLVAIDLSYNQIDCNGASWIAQLSCLRAVTKNLRLLNLQHNRIAQKGALEVIESFASKSIDLQIKLEGNAMESSSIFLTLAKYKYEAETELQDLKKDCDRLRADKQDAQSNIRELLTAQSAMINDMENLKAKTKHLEEDRVNLIKAFSVMGMVQHVEERDNILKRLAKLEESVHGNTSTNGRNTKSDSSTSRLRSFSPPQPTNISRTPQRYPSSESRRRSRSPACLSITATALSSTGAEKTQTPSRQVPSRPSRAGKATKARDLLVKAASERWKSIIKSDDEESPTGKQNGRSSRKQVSRSKSSKSLAEFLNTSAPEVRGEESFSSYMDERSAQTTPSVFGLEKPAPVHYWRRMGDRSAPAAMMTPATLGSARRRMRQKNTRPTRNLPQRKEPLSMPTGMDNSSVLHESSAGSSYESLTVEDYTRRK